MTNKDTTGFLVDTPIFGQPADPLHAAYREGRAAHFRRQLADVWREANGYTQRDGVVILFNGEVQGWCNALRDPGHWRPGCIAIDERGGQWVSAGGNEEHGAKRWQPLREEVETRSNGKRLLSVADAMAIAAANAKVIRRVDQQGQITLNDVRYHCRQTPGSVIELTVTPDGPLDPSGQPLVPVEYRS